ncbi:hypothetical protein CFAM422_005227 [Trichoderma lentiforme]|uniref:Uncharacterized protein n=1 Tax=Trichoderma lentiforme TaxID=1567552 RepID=A0A9P4XGS6_9HYPO|nr:hypothetical protein CFAM422_005227 [Trichoderma lentiforme]
MPWDPLIISRRDRRCLTSPVSLESSHQILYPTNDCFGNVTTTVIAVLVPYKQTERLSYPISVLETFRRTAPLPARCQQTEVPGRLVTCSQNELHFIDAALEGGRGTDLQLSYARTPDIVQDTRLTMRVMDFAAPNTDNKEAASHDYNPQCHLLTPDPIYKRNALVNNNVPTCARDVLSEHVSLVIIGEAKESLADGLDEEQLIKDA